MDGLGPDGEDALTPRQRRSARLATALVVPLTAVLLGLVLVFFVFFHPTTIAGPSMYPTLRDHDYVLITKGLAKPQRGDIVVLRVVYRGKSEEWVKRVVAVGGDRVNVAGDLITVNGEGEKFPHMIIDGGARWPVLQIDVPKGHVFVAGDNRTVALDSRLAGTFPATAIDGRVVAIYAPISRMGLVPEP